MDPYQNLNLSRLRHCDQAWEKMPHTDSGRLCQKCSRAIVDFTGKTNAEIALIHGQSASGVCGLYRRNQIVKPKSVKIIRTSLGIRTIVLAGLSWLVTPPHAEAKDKRGSLMWHAHRSAKKTTNIFDLEHYDSADSLIRVMGKVTSLSDGSALPGVIVLIKGTSIATSTNVDGDFMIETHALADSITEVELVVTFIGYKSLIVKTSRSPKEALNIQLDDDRTQIYEYLIYRSPLYKRIWYRMTFRFRRW